MHEKLEQGSKLLATARYVEELSSSLGCLFSVDADIANATISFRATSPQPALKSEGSNEAREMTMNISRATHNYMQSRTASTPLTNEPPFDGAAVRSVDGPDRFTNGYDQHLAGDGDRVWVVLEL